MKSFLDGRPIVTRSGSIVSRTDSQLPSFHRAATDSATPAHTGSGPVHKREHGEQKIETVTVDGVVQKFIVICACGERIEVHCGY